MKLHLKHHEASQKQHNPRGTYTGANWSHSTLRPGCQDHLKYFSRRGDELVPHRGPIGVQSSMPRGGLPRLVMDLQRLAGKAP